MRSLHVVHLTSVHAPGDPRISHKECAALVGAGYRVTLVAPAREHAAIPGVRVLTVPLTRSRWQRIFLTGARVLRAALRTDADLYHLHDPELIPAGIVLRALGRRVIYDAHEHLPLQVATKRWIPPLLRPLAKWLASGLETLAARLFSGIVVANPTSVDRFERAVRRPEKLALVQNFPRIEEFADAGSTPYTDRERLIVYAGGIEPQRGVSEMVAAVASLDDEQVRLILAGRVSDSDRAEIEALDERHRVVLTGWLSRQEMGELLARARVGLSVLHPLPNYLANYPTKMFEYMAAAIPCVVSNFPLWRQVVESARCGIAVDPLAPDQIARAISELLDDPGRAAAMGERGRRAVTSVYNWDVEAEKLLALYARCLERN